MPQSFSGCYRLAGHCIEIHSCYPEIHALCRDYRCEDAPDYLIVTTEADIESEQEKSDADRRKQNREPVRFSRGYLETNAVYRKMAAQLLDADILLMHGSVVALEGEAFLFTAKSGTGKSTHTQLWLQQFGSRAFILNDDKPLLHIGADAVTVYGTPWDGKHHRSRNAALPLKAICILTRAAENHIESCRFSDAYPMLLQQTHRPATAEKLSQMLHLLDRLNERMPLFRLGCNQQPDAAVTAYYGIKEKIG